MHYDRDGAMFYHVVMVVSDRNRPGTSLMQYLVSSGSPLQFRGWRHLRRAALWGLVAGAFAALAVVTRLRGQRAATPVLRLAG